MSGCQVNPIYISGIQGHHFQPPYQVNWIQFIYTQRRSSLRMLEASSQMCVCSEAWLNPCEKGLCKANTINLATGKILRFKKSKEGREKEQEALKHALAEHHVLARRRHHQWNTFLFIVPVVAETTDLQLMVYQMGITLGQIRAFGAALSAESPFCINLIFRRIRSPTILHHNFEGQGLYCLIKSNIRRASRSADSVRS